MKTRQNKSWKVNLPKCNYFYIFSMCIKMCDISKKINISFGQNDKVAQFYPDICTSWVFYFFSVNNIYIYVHKLIYNVLFKDLQLIKKNMLLQICIRSFLFEPDITFNLKGEVHSFSIIWYVTVLKKWRRTKKPQVKNFICSWDIAVQS